MRTWTKRLVGLTAWWGWTPLVYILWWLSTHAWPFKGMRWAQYGDQWMMAQFWHGHTLFWWWLFIGFVGTVLIVSGSAEGDLKDWRPATKVSSIVAGALATILAIVSLVQIIRVPAQSGKDLGRYYNTATVFYVPDPSSPPPSLQRLANNARHASTERCDLIGNADVPSCIKQGTLPTTGWDARVGSLDGTGFALSRTSGDVQKVSLDKDTLTYLNAVPAKPATDGRTAQEAQLARWSGILDGSGKYQSLGGVAEWTGNGQPNQCLFTKQYAINRAIDGSKGNSLTHLMAEKFPALRWDKKDAWGYCNGSEPIVVLPMTRQIYWIDRTVDTAGGVVTVQGDNGGVKLTYYPTVKSGQFPGPVYPASVVAYQREQSSWAAGRKNRNSGFGYEPADSDAQEGNVSEYLLRNAATGRLEWVTPLTLRSSTSQLFLAYSVTLADEVTNGSLNQMSIYVLAENDPRRINIDNLEADAQNYVRQINPGFLANNAGKLVEYTPVDGDHWRAFGELNGRVVYYLDISASRKIAPKLVSLDPTAVPGTEPAQPSQPTSPQSPSTSEQSNRICGSDLSQLAPSDLARCLKLLADELNRRQQVTPPK